MADNRSLCEAWVNSNSRIHRGNNMSIGQQGDLYSYSTCIGQRVQCGGKVLYIVDTARYSVATSKHQLYMMHALRDVHPNRIFDVNNAVWGRTRFVPIKDGVVLNAKKYIAQVAIFFIAQEMLHCMRVATCRSVNHGFTRHGYAEAVRLLEYTGVATVKNLLRMKVCDFISTFGEVVHELDASYDEFKEMRRNLRKFLHLMADAADIPTITDAINGAGCWEAYMKRTAGARKRMENRKKAAATQYVAPHAA